MDRAKESPGAPIGQRDSALAPAQRDVLALAIAFAAILMFVGTGGSVLSGIVRSIAGHGGGPDRLLTNALLLNIALIIFGWRRYRDLTGEVAERRRAEEQARLLAETDPLTGSLNRRSVAAQTDFLVETSHAQSRAVAAIMVDLDNFKQVNDVHGHLAGDEMLREAARRIAAQLPPGSLLSRFGGDEFACVVPFDPAHGEAIDRLAEALIGAVARPVRYNNVDIETTISIGLTRSDGHDRALDAQALLHVADIAMYHAKKHGKNGFAWFDPAMETELRFRSELEAGIRSGIPAGEFVPYYEKQIDMASGELVGFEMLARWNSPRLGVVKPDVFIPVAEEIGLIADLSESVIAQALVEARKWNPRLTLSVNISPVQLRDPWFAQKLLKLLVESNFPPERLEIEITESCLHENIALVRSMIVSLKNQGIKVSLDDFGTGYSSLSQLNSLPFDRIKIDRSFVTQLPDNPEYATIVRSITSLGEGLGLPITAEGVETEEVFRALAEFGSFNAQGYFFGKPATAEQTRDELAQLELLLEPPAPAQPVSNRKRRASNG